MTQIGYMTLTIIISLSSLLGYNPNTTLLLYYWHWSTLPYPTFLFTFLPTLLSPPLPFLPQFCGGGALGGLYGQHQGQCPAHSVQGHRVAMERWGEVTYCSTRDLWGSGVKRHLIIIHIRLYLNALTDMRVSSHTQISLLINHLPTTNY